MSALNELFHKREELPDGGHLDIHDPMNETNEATPVDSNVEKIFLRMHAFQNEQSHSDTSDDDDLDMPDDAPKDWIWADVPDDIQDRLKQWRDMFVKAVPGASLVKHLHITLFHRILNFNDDLRVIINTAANTTPLDATLAGLKMFRTDKDGIAIAIEVVSQQLRDLRHKLSGFVEHIPSIHPRYIPHITLAYVPNTVTVEMDGMELHGIYGQQFVIDGINAGTYDSNHRCVMLGADPAWIGRTQPTVKAMGMSTLDGVSGGLLAEPISNMPDDDEDGDEDNEQYSEKFNGDDPDDDDDDDDEQWIHRSRQMADTLDNLFGDT